MKNKKRINGRTRRIILLAVLILLMIWILAAAVRHFMPKKDGGSSSDNMVPAQESPAEGASDESLTAENTPGGSDSPEASSAENPSGESDSTGASSAENPSDESDSTGASSAGNPSDKSDSTGASSAENPSGNSLPEEHISGSEEGSTGHHLTELERGQEYLAGLAERKPDEVEAEIDEARVSYAARKEREAWLARREAYRKTLEGDAVWSSFDDYVFLGDSRVIGFSLYGFLSQDRVLAETGDNINAVTDHLDEIRSLSPKYIFISYGINDIACGLWPDADHYEEAVSGILQTLQEALPEAEIYVNSILPASEDAIAYAPIWGSLPEFSEALRRACDARGVSFIDNTSLVDEHKDLYEGDGVHVQPEFYRYWAENQLLGIYDRQTGAPEEAPAQSPEEAPAQAPEEAPAQAPETAPAQTPEEAPAQNEP